MGEAGSRAADVVPTRGVEAPLPNPPPEERGGSTPRDRALMPLRLVFMGTPDFAVPTLVEIVGSGHQVVAAYTRAPKPAGRGMELRPSPVEREARRLGIEVLTPKTLKTPQAQEAFARP